MLDLQTLLAVRQRVRAIQADIPPESELQGGLGLVAHELGIMFDEALANAKANQKAEALAAK